MMVCPNCGEMKLAHVVCKKCGYYDGRLVKEIKVKEEEKAEAAEPKKEKKAKKAEAAEAKKAEKKTAKKQDSKKE